MEFSLVHLPPTTLSEVLSAWKGEGIFVFVVRRSHVAQAIPASTIGGRMILNFWSSCLHLLSSRILGKVAHAQFM